jgi:hypothetical protein
MIITNINKYIKIVFSVCVRLVFVVEQQIGCAAFILVSVRITT